MQIPKYDMYIFLKGSHESWYQGKWSNYSTLCQQKQLFMYHWVTCLSLVTWKLRYDWVLFFLQTLHQIFLLLYLMLLNWIQESKNFTNLQNYLYRGKKRKKKKNGKKYCSSMWGEDIISACFKFAWAVNVVTNISRIKGVGHPLKYM